MSREKIIDSALRRFARKGYGGTSLTEIASDVGIRKPSLYAHFNGKKAIFLTLLEQCFIEEKTHIEALLADERPPQESMRSYLLAVPARFEANSRLQFWLRAIYMPEPDVAAEIRKCDEEYALFLDQSILRKMRAAANGSALDLENAADAYNGMLKGIHAELLYKGVESGMKKAASLWNVFELVFAGGSK